MEGIKLHKNSKSTDGILELLFLARKKLKLVMALLILLKYAACKVAEAKEIRNERTIFILLISMSSDC
jgi:hypothetical protein